MSECRNPEIAEWSETWIQDGDSNDESDQMLKLTAEDAGAGPFLVIETKRWSLDPGDVDALCDLLKRFIERK